MISAEAPSDHRETASRLLAAVVDAPTLDRERSAELPLRALLAALAEADLMPRAGEGTSHEHWRRVALYEELVASSAMSALLGAVAHVELALPWLCETGAVAEIAVQASRGVTVLSHGLPVGATSSLVASRTERGFVVDGAVPWVANAGEADHHVVAAALVRTDAMPISWVVLVVPARGEGIEVGPSVHDERGLALPIATHLRFEAVEVPASCAVDEVSGASIERRWRHGRVMLSCAATSVAEQCARAADDRARQRKSFGVELRRHQAVRFRLAELRTSIEASRRLAYAAVAASTTGRDDASLAAVAVGKASRLVNRAAEDCMVVHGAAGYLVGHPATRLVREARLLATMLRVESAPTAEPHAPSLRVGADRGRISRVVESSLRPLIEALPGRASVPVREALAVLAERQCLGVGFPIELGGTGGDLWDCVALHEEIARLGSSSLATAVLSQLEVGTRLVADHATKGVAAHWVPAALRGEVVLGYAATEEHAGSDLAATTTTARRDGDMWVVDGAKKFITNACDADALCVLARTSDRNITSHTLLLVPMSSPGVVARRLESIGNRHTLGEVTFRGVRVHEDNMIGFEGQGLLLQVRRLAHERAFVAVSLAALADSALHDMAELGGDAADLAADIAEAQALAYHAVAVIAGGEDARVPAAMAKLVARRALHRVAEAALRAAGPSAYEAGTPVAQAFYDAMGFAFGGGTDNMLLEAIAR